MFEFRCVPNPYKALDAKGRPAALVPYVGQTDRGVGATLDPKASEKEKRAIFTFAFDPVRIVAANFGELAYYKRFAEDGALLPADTASAKTLGVPFVPPEETLEESRDGAALAFLDATGAFPPWVTEEAAARLEAPVNDGVDGPDLEAPRAAEGEGYVSSLGPDPKNDGTAHTAGDDDDDGDVGVKEE